MLSALERLTQSKRFWALLSAAITIIGYVCGVPIDPVTVLSIVGVLCSFVLGHSVRPLAGRTLSIEEEQIRLLQPASTEPHLYQPDPPGPDSPRAGKLQFDALMFLAVIAGLLLGMGYLYHARQSAKPIISNEVELVATSHLRSLADGYSDAYETLSKSVATGEITTSEALQQASVAATKSGRQHAEATVVDYWQKQFPQNEDGTWKSRDEVAKFLHDLSCAYKTVRSSRFPN